LTSAVKFKGHRLPNIAFVKLVFEAFKIGNGNTVDRAKNVTDLNLSISTAVSGYFKNKKSGGGGGAESDGGCGISGGGENSEA